MAVMMMMIHSVHEKERDGEKGERGGRGWAVRMCVIFHWVGKHCYKYTSTCIIDYNKYNNNCVDNCTKKGFFMIWF